MRRTLFADARTMMFQDNRVGEDSVGLEVFRRLLPPFIHIEVIQPDSPEYDDLKVHSVLFDAGERLTHNVIRYQSQMIEDQMGEGTKHFSASRAADSIIQGDNGRKLGIPLIKNMIAEIMEETDSDYLAGVTKVYLIHPPHLESELRGHLSVLPVPASADMASERLINIAFRDKSYPFVVQPFPMDLTGRESADPRWLIVHLYNPDKPALAIRVPSQGPLTFKEPTPLLSDTEVAETWGMEAIGDYLRDAGVAVQDVCHEPNGPKTFPDYQAHLNGYPLGLRDHSCVGRHSPCTPYI